MSLIRVPILLSSPLCLRFVLFIYLYIYLLPSQKSELEQFREERYQLKLGAFRMFEVSPEILQCVVDFGAWPGYQGPESRHV